jgi:hypothetical protein
MHMKARLASPQLWPVILAALLVVATPRTSLAQEDSRLPEVAILQDFGTNGQLKFDGMRRYLISKAFVEIDANEDKVIDIDEYLVARLYVKPGVCAPPSDPASRFTEDKTSGGGPLTAEALYKGNAAWKLHIDQQAAAHWKRTRQSEDGALDLAGVRKYLADEKARTSMSSTTESRLEALRKQLNVATLPASVDELPLRGFFRGERFDAIDEDASGSIDASEFASAFATPQEMAEFCAVAGSDFLLNRQEFETPNNEAPSLQRALLLVFPFFGPTPLAELRHHLDAQEHAAKAAAKLRNISPHGYVPGRGFLLSGKRKVDQKKVVYDPDVPATFIRVIQDFTIDSPDAAEPATFSVTKEKGTSASIALDAAIQVTRDPASRTLLGVSAGVDIERNTATDPETDRQRYYVTLDLFFFKGGSLFESHAIQFAPFREHDRQKDVKRWAGDIIWVPGLHVGRFRTSRWLQIGAHANWYVTPRLVLELAESGDAEDEPNGTHARLELLWGLKAGRFNSTLKTFHRRGIGNDLGRSYFGEASAWWNLDDLRRFSLKSSASWGKKSPTDLVNKTKFTIGLGVKF